MHPKTFQVRLRQPFGAVTQETYIFYLHVESAAEALAWVGHVFDGIDLRQTPALSRPRIGSANVVNVTDCDVFRKHARVRGRFQAIDTPIGHFRQPEAEIAAQLRTIGKNLQSECARLARAFASLKTDYEREGAGWVYERLVLIQQMHMKATRWEANVLQEYIKATPKDNLVLPEKRLHLMPTRAETAAQEQAPSMG